MKKQKFHVKIIPGCESYSLSFQSYYLTFGGVFKVTSNFSALLLAFHGGSQLVFVFLLIASFSFRNIFKTILSYFMFIRPLGVTPASSS